MKKTYLLFPLALVCICATILKISNRDPLKEKLNDYILAATLYNQVSGEYRALTLQAYNIARLRLDQKLTDFNKNKKIPDSLAVIVDLDETILNNSAFEGYIIKDTSSFTEEWDNYIQSIRATDVPGAVEFLDSVDQYNISHPEFNKIRIFYITNRNSLQLVATAKLEKLHFPQINSSNDYKSNFNLLVKRIEKDPTQNDNKEFRFQEVRNHYTVLLQLGDNLNDFSGDFFHKSNKIRDSIVSAKESSFGYDYIILPNAMYGDWIAGLCKQPFSKMSLHQQDSTMRANIKGYK